MLLLNFCEDGGLNCGDGGVYRMINNYNMLYITAEN